MRRRLSRKQQWLAEEFLYGGTETLPRRGAGWAVGGGGTEVVEDFGFSEAEGREFEVVAAITVVVDMLLKEVPIE